MNCRQQNLNGVGWRQHRVAMISIGLVVLLAVGPQSVQGRSATDRSGNRHVCTIRDSDDELLSCTGSRNYQYLDRTIL